jgi:hypothetical protein
VYPPATRVPPRVEGPAGWIRSVGVGGARAVVFQLHVAPWQRAQDMEPMLRDAPHACRAQMQTSTPAHEDTDAMVCMPVARRHTPGRCTGSSATRARAHTRLPCPDEVPVLGCRKRVLVLRSAVWTAHAQVSQVKLRVASWCKICWLPATPSAGPV